MFKRIDETRFDSWEAVKQQILQLPNSVKFLLTTVFFVVNTIVCSVSGYVYFGKTYDRSIDPIIIHLILDQF
jgi:hypothetical protein